MRPCLPLAARCIGYFPGLAAAFASSCFDSLPYGPSYYMQNFYVQVVGPDFEARSSALDDEILQRLPDVVCLQEVFTRHDKETTFKSIPIHSQRD